MSGTATSGELADRHAEKAAEVNTAELTRLEKEYQSAARWEFNDRRKLLYALVGNDFGPEPETRLPEIREYKRREAQFLIDVLKLKPTDQVLDLGSGCGFVARAVRPLCNKLYCLDISSEFLSFCRDELREFQGVEFHQMPFADLTVVKGRGINKGYANAVFIHFNLFDIVLYFQQLFEVLEPGGLFVFGMSDTDCLDIKSDRYFPVVLDAYQRHRREPTLMHWNSSKAVCAAAEKIGFRSKLLCAEGGSAMVLLEKPGVAPKLAPTAVPPNQLLDTYRQFNGTLAALRGGVENLLGQFPGDRDAGYLFAETLHCAGCDDLALLHYQSLLKDCPPNEFHRVQQGMQQCQVDQDYFPPTYATRLTTAEYAAGHNAEIWRAYARKEIQRGREIVRMLRQVTSLRNRRVLDVGSGYGGMLICMAEAGADVSGIEIDVERANMGRQRISDLGMQIPYQLGDICDSDTAAQLGKFDVIVCQDVLEHVMDPALVIRSLCAMLHPNGAIFVQIPNKYGIDQMMRDHHYGLTGLTTLSRDQAIEYWQNATGEAACNYTVGFERGEKFYNAAFARGGVRLNPVDRFTSIEHVLWYASPVSEMCKRLEREIHSGLRPALARKVRRRMTKVAQLYAHASQQIVALKDQHELLAVACDMVVRRLCVGLWRFIGIKADDGTGV